MNFKKTQYVQIQRKTDKVTVMAKGETLISFVPYKQQRITQRSRNVF